MGPRRLDVYVIPIGPNTRVKAFEITRQLRQSGLNADIDLVGRGPSKNLDYANLAGALHCVLIGEKEAARGLVALRDMQSGEQTEVSISNLVGALRAGPVTKS